MQLVEYDKGFVGGWMPQKKSVLPAIIAAVLMTYGGLAMGAAPWVGVDLKGKNCTGKRTGFGPYDYRTAPEHIKNLVEGRHFRPDVEYLRGGEAGAISPLLEIPGNLDYTLRALPNHHRALLTIIRFQLRVNKKIIKQRLFSPVECYLQRAINYAPTDPVVYFLYGYYLHKIGHLESAAKQFEKSLDLSPDTLTTQYSYALLLIDLKQYDKALETAKKVYSKGNFHPGLRNKLRKLGVWEDEPENLKQQQ